MAANRIMREDPSEAHVTAGLEFQPLERSDRLSDRVAKLILARIVESGLKPGDPLPSERVLGQQFGVSRTVVREAIRSLAGRGIITVRPGAGLTVAELDTSTASESISLLLRGTTDRYDKVDEVRRLIEVHVAGLAAERATDEDIARIRGALAHQEQVIDDVDAVAPADGEFHRQLALATHNELFVVMLDSLGDVMLEMRRRAMRPAAGRKVFLREHRAVVEAVAARDPAAARAAMVHHLDDSNLAFRAQGGGAKAG